MSGLGQDKATSNSIVQWKGVGLDLGARAPGSKKIGEAVANVIEDDSFKKKAAELSHHYKKYNIGRVFDQAVQDAINDWKVEMDKPVGDEL